MPHAQPAAISSDTTMIPASSPPNAPAPAVAADRNVTWSAATARLRSRSSRWKPAAELPGPVPMTSRVSAA